MGTLAWRPARSVSGRRTAASSTTGSVLGIAITAQKPPAAAAAVPVSMSSLYSWPGVRRWTCGSTKPGNAWWPVASIVSMSGCARERPRRAELGDPAVPDEDVVRAVEVGAGIEDVGARDQELGGCGWGVVEGSSGYAAAWRIGALTSSS